MNNDLEEYKQSLDTLGIRYEVHEHPELHTPPEVQAFLGLTPRDGLSTLIMKTNKGFIALIRRDDCKVDFKKVKKFLHLQDLRMATQDEFVSLTGQPIGAARVYNPNIPTYLDKGLFEVDYLTGGTGSFVYSFRYRSEDLKKIPNSSIIEM